MNVTLNIESDAELRAYIKESIKNQVLGITREEFFQTVKEEMTRKLKGTDVRNLDRLIKEGVKEVVREQLAVAGVSTWRTDVVEPIIREVVGDVLESKGIDNLINKAADEKIKQLLYYRNGIDPQ